MNNYKLLIQYDGTDYAGWQYQLNAVTIQQKIFESIKILLNEDVFALNEKYLPLISLIFTNKFIGVNSCNSWQNFLYE